MACRLGWVGVGVGFSTGGRFNFSPERRNCASGVQVRELEKDGVPGKREVAGGGWRRGEDEESRESPRCRQVANLEMQQGGGESDPLGMSARKKTVALGTVRTNWSDSVHFYLGYCSPGPSQPGRG